MSTSGIDNIISSGADGEWSCTRRLARRTPEGDAHDTALRTDYAALLGTAVELNGSGAAAIEAAKKAIEQGTLDTAENIQTAAENILKFGI